MRDVGHFAICLKSLLKNHALGVVLSLVIILYGLGLVLGLIGNHMLAHCDFVITVLSEDWPLPPAEVNPTVNAYWSSLIHS